MKLVWCLIVTAVFVLVFLPEGEAKKKDRSKSTSREVRTANTSRQTSRSSSSRTGRVSTARKASAKHSGGKTVRKQKKSRAKGGRRNSKKSREGGRRGKKDRRGDRKRGVRKQKKSDRKAERARRNKKNLEMNGGSQRWSAKGKRAMMTITVVAPKEIKIISGKYGKDDKSNDVTDVLAKICNGKPECSMRVDDETFGTVAGVSRKDAELIVEWEASVPEFTTRQTNVRSSVTPEVELQNMVCAEKEAELVEKEPELSPKCECKAWGDPHYEQFDQGQRLNFQGDCEYILSQTKTESDPCYYKVWAKNTKRSPSRTVSYTEKVYVEFRPSPESEGLINIMFDRSSTWLLDGNPMNRDHDGNGFWEVKVGSELVFRRVMESNPRCDLEVRFNGDDRASIVIRKLIGKDVIGLCGNCDDLANDLVTATGQEPEECAGRTKTLRENACDAIIGASFLVDGVTVNERGVSCASPKDDLSCQGDDLTTASSNAFCGFFKNPEGPFGECLRILEKGKIDSMYHSCLEDVCQEKEVQFACKALASLHESCSEMGVYPEWRTAEFCPKVCPSGSSYLAKCPAIRETCKPQAVNLCAPQPFSEGCICDVGMVEDDGLCIPRGECTNKCLYDDGTMMKHGEKRMFENCKQLVECFNGKITRKDSPCELDRNAEACSIGQTFSTCDCKEGFGRLNEESRCRKLDPKDPVDPVVQERRKLNKKRDVRRKRNAQKRKDNKKKQRRNCRQSFGKKNRGKKRASGGTCTAANPTECVCSARGDPHYKPFDFGKEQKIDFQGDCSYTISKTKDDNHPCAYHVIGKNVKTSTTSTVATTKQITIIWKQEKHTAVFMRGLKLKLDGNDDVSTPIVPGTEPWKITRTSCALVFEIKTDTCFVQITFDGKHEAVVTIPKTMGGDVEGICGNCNDIMDDWVTKDGDDVGDMDKPIRDRKIGKSWAVYDPASTAEHCSDNTIELICDTEWETRATSLEFCGAIKSIEDANPFKECIASNLISEDELDTLLDQCKQDVCATYLEPNFDLVFCQKLESMAKLCGGQGVPVDWRGSYEQCTMPCDDTNNEVYQFDAPGCPAICGQAEPDECDLADLEGCVCKPGYVRSGDRCVHEVNECGCTEENGMYFELGATWQYKDCNTMKTCSPGAEGKSVITSMEVEACKEPHQFCKVSEDGAVSCDCTPGYKPENGECVDLVTCVENEIYSPISPVLEKQNSCSKLDSVTKSTPTEFGCICQSGYVRKHTSGPCLPADTACTCTDTNGNPRNLNDVWYNADCTKLHRCDLIDSGALFLVPGIVNEDVSCANGQCQTAANGDKSCVCDLGYDMVGKQCVARCETPEYEFVPDGLGDGKCRRLQATCKATPDGFFQTFDGMRFKRQKNCEYLLLKSNPGEACQATVTMKAQDGTDWIDYVKVIYEKGTKRAEVLFKHGECKQAEVNGVTSKPLGSQSGIGPCSGVLYHNNGKISAKWYQSCSVQVIFDGSKSVFVTLNHLQGNPSPLLGKVTGLCGNANDVAEDDIVTQDGLDVLMFHNAVNYDMFAHSWRVDESCEACDPDAEALRLREDVCEIYVDDDKVDKPDDVKACLKVVSKEIADRARLSCRHAICSRYNGDRIGMFHTVCNFWITFRKACEAKGIVMSYKPYGCKFCKCSVMGDPHIKQFDQNVVDYMDKCKYIYAEHNDPNHECYFRVEVDHDDRGTGRVSWARSMDVILSNDANRNVVSFVQGKAVLWNGAPASPFSEKAYGDIKISMWGEYLLLRWDKCGLKVQFDSEKSAGHIEISPVHGKYVKGVCGNCDGDPTNDLFTKDGVDVSGQLEPDNFKTFGRSYMSPDVEDPTTCETEYNGRECNPQIAAALDTPAFCGYFLKQTPGPFQTCTESIVQMDLGGMRNDCQFDVCMTDGDESTICNSLSNLEDQCKLLGFDVSWRSKTFCPTDCGTNAEYMSVASNCEETCAGINADCVDSDPSPGCRCKSGYVRSEDGCVSRSECGCMHEGTYHPLTNQFADEDCNTLYECSPGPAVSQIKQLNQCGDEEKASHCEQVGVAYACVPDDVV